MGNLEGAAQALFKAPINPDDVVDCRVVRARVQVNGLAGAVTAASVGLAPTWITVVLNDGRTFKAHSRGDGPDKEAIERVGAGLNARRAQAAREALQSDRAATFGSCVLSSAGLRLGKKSFAWDDFVGFRVGEGYLQLDTARGLAASVLLSAVPFGDALATVVSEQLPAKDYAQRPPSEWPRFGFLAPSAATHQGGTMTGRGRVAILGGLVALGLLAGGGWLGWDWYLHNITMPADYAEQAQAKTEAGRKFTGDDAAFFAHGLKACPKPDQNWSWAGPALVATGDGPRAYWIMREGAWRKVDKLMNSPDELYAWTVGPKDGQPLLRVVKQTHQGPECRLAHPLTPEESGRPEEVARQLIAQALPSLDLDAPPPAPPAPPVAEPAAAAPTAKAADAKKKKPSRVKKKTRSR